MDAVEITDVTKTFGNFAAVKSLSLRVPTGTVYGFIGPNGSGKSTTLRMIMRILLPDCGSVQVLGSHAYGAANDRIGYLPEERGLYKKMKVREVLIYHAELKGMVRPRAAVDAWLERLGLGDWGGHKVEALSKGMAQKVQFIATVVAKPDLIVLDEPFSGLDPVNMDALRDAILELNRQGSTIIFSTHDMNVAERMCDYIFMIYQGNKVLDGTLRDIQESYGTDTVRVSLENGTTTERLLAGLPGVAKVVDFGNLQELRLERNTDSQVLLAELMRRGRVKHFEIGRPSLHDIFVRIAAPANPEL